MELNTIWTTEAPIAVYISTPIKSRIGTSTVPPPIPKKPDANPTKTPKIINKKIIISLFCTLNANSLKVIILSN